MEIVYKEANIYIKNIFSIEYIVVSIFHNIIKIIKQVTPFF